MPEFRVVYRYDVPPDQGWEEWGEGLLDLFLAEVPDGGPVVAAEPSGVDVTVLLDASEIPEALVAALDVVNALAFSLRDVPHPISVGVEVAR